MKENLLSELAETIHSFKKCKNNYKKDSISLNVGLVCLQLLHDLSLLMLATPRDAFGPVDGVLANVLTTSNLASAVKYARPAVAPILLARKSRVTQ